MLCPGICLEALKKITRNLTQDSWSRNWDSNRELSKYDSIGCSERRLIGHSLDIGTSCERAAPFAEKNAAARHHVLRSLISLHNEHRVQRDISTPTLLYYYITSATETVSLYKNRGKINKINFPSSCHNAFIATGMSHSSCIPVAPTWSIGHPWNSSFHFSWTGD
jgi:hypothetical protein